MFGYNLSNLLSNILATGFPKEIYHSVILTTRDGETIPAAPVKGRFIYVGVDDTTGFGSYVRQTGTADVVKETLIGGCSKMYDFQIPFRMVFFNGSEPRRHEEITARLAKVFFVTPNITLKKIHNIAGDLLAKEVPSGKFSFTSATYYVAFDFLLLLRLQAENCITEISCEGIANPYCSN